MATLTIRNIDESVKKMLRLRAARNGRSMEEEARQLIRQGLLRERAEGLGSRIARRFASSGVDLDVPKRRPVRRPPDLDSRQS